MSLVSSRQRSIFSTIGCSSRSEASTRASVEKPVLPAAVLETELLEEDRRQLLRRADREPLAREVVDVGLELVDLGLETRCGLGQRVGVELQAVALDLNEHGDERQFDTFEEIAQAELFDLRLLLRGDVGDGPRVDRQIAQRRRRSRRSRRRWPRADAVRSPSRGSRTGGGPSRSGTAAMRVSCARRGTGQSLPSSCSFR